MEDTGLVVIFGGRSEIGVELAQRMAGGRTVLESAAAALPSARTVRTRPAPSFEIAM